MEAATIVGFMLKVHALDRVPRAGYLLRGVAEPESVAAHSHSLALLTEIVASAAPPGTFDLGRAVAMALVHDTQEVVTMDIPMPAGDAEFKRARSRAEAAIFDGLYAGLGERYAGLFAEFEAAATPEARLVRGLDKVQMLIKVVGYEREGRGRLRDFWEHPENFRDYGLEPVRLLFGEVLRIAGRSPPPGVGVAGSRP